MTTFSTFVTGTSTAKVACVRTFKGGYDPQHDYWKALREAIPKSQTSPKGTALLDGLMQTIGERKSSNYRLRIASYKRWLNKNKPTWRGGKSRTWSAGGIEIGVNPELFVDMGDEPYVIKLYFNKDKISGDRANTMLRLMELAYQRGGGYAEVGVLDLGQGRLITPTRSLEYLDPLLSGEAGSFASVYAALP